MAVYFSIFLVIVTFITGIIWFIDHFVYAPKRQLKLADAQAQCGGKLSGDAIERITQPSVIADTSIQIFPVIAFVMILRSFIYEPFQIPSGSMMPTLLDGDFILVNKFNYGLRDPVVRNKFVEIGAPERGDAIVFKYPENPQIDYIKRVIGLPGDRVIYRNKSLYIKEACNEQDKTCGDYQQVLTEFKPADASPDGSYGLNRYTANMLGREHDILIDNQVIPRTPHYYQQAGSQRDEFIVPKGHYFVMGDNRDNSLDGRFWGFVPEENLVGEAVAIWMSFSFDRDSDSFLPSWVPTGVRLERIGGIH